VPISGLGVVLRFAMTVSLFVFLMLFSSVFSSDYFTHNAAPTSPSLWSRFSARR
jgi:hypothetical protein